MEGQFPCRTAASAGYCVAPTPAAPLLLPVLELSSGLWCWATRRPVSIILGVGSYFCGSTAGSWVFAPGCWERWGGAWKELSCILCHILGLRTLLLEGAASLSPPVSVSCWVGAGFPCR